MSERMRGPEEVFVTNFAQRLLVRIWKPESAPRAVVAICHGFNSHSGYYFWAAERLAAAGYAIYAVDLRGRGRSDGERFYVESIDDYVMDVDAMVNLAASREPGAPVYLLGHSAGGVTACIYALAHPLRLAGLISESLSFRVPAPRIAIAVFKFLSDVIPHTRVLRLKNEHFTRDPCRLARMQDDPLIHDERQPLDTVAALLRANERLAREFPRITLPTLILHGTEDRVALPVGSQCFLRDLGARDKLLKLYTGHFHDLLNDIGRAEVLADIRQWLDARVARVGAERQTCDLESIA